MKEIKATDNPTEELFLHMAENLSKKFKVSACVHCTAWIFHHEDIEEKHRRETEYILFICEVDHWMKFSSFQSCLDHYFKLMREGIPSKEKEEEEEEESD